MPPPAAQSHVSRLRWLYPISLAATVIIASGRSQVAAPAIGYFDKIAHFAIFGLLATVVARCPGVHRFRYAILAVSAFGIADEIRQSFTPGRFVEVADWIADTAGAALAVTLYAFWPWYRRLLETPLRLWPRPASTTTSPASPATATDDSVSAPAA